MGKYKKCPRCELNWILSEDELCEVCKAEMGKASSISLLEEDDDELGLDERICPICKVNYLEPDEDICASCRAEQASRNIEKSEDDGWQDFVDDDEPITDDEGEVSLSQLQEDELDEDEEDERNDEPDDFDESIGDINDYEEDEEEDEDDDF